MKKVIKNSLACLLVVFGLGLGTVNMVNAEAKVEKQKRTLIAPNPNAKPENETENETENEIENEIETKQTRTLDTQNTDVTTNDSQEETSKRSKILRYIWIDVAIVIGLIAIKIHKDKKKKENTDSK